MITLKEILDGSKDREMEIREEIKKINELLKLLPTTNSNYDIWLNKKNDLEARLGKKESVKKEAYARTPDEMAMKNYNKKYADLTPEQKKEVDIELGDLMQELGESCKKDIQEKVTKDTIAIMRNNKTGKLFEIPVGEIPNILGGALISGDATFVKYKETVKKEEYDTNKIPQMIKDYNLGMTLEQIAKKYETDVNTLKVRLFGTESVKKEAYTIIKVDGAEVPIEINPDGNEGKDMKGNRYLKLDGKWVMENFKEYNTVMQGSPTDYKIGSRVRIVGGLYSNLFGKITAMKDNEITVETESDEKKVKVLPKQIVMAESFTNVMKALKEGMSKYDPTKVVRKEGISKDTEKWIYDMYQKGATTDDIKDVLRIQKGIDMPLDGIIYIIQNYKEGFKEAVVGQKIVVGNFDSDYPAIVTGVDNGKVTTAQVKMYGITNEVIIDNDKWWVAKEALKEANPVSDYDDKELNDKAQDLFGKGFQFLSDAERKQVLDSFKESKDDNYKDLDADRREREIDEKTKRAEEQEKESLKEVICNTCKKDAEIINERPYCNTCQKYLDESLKEYKVDSFCPKCKGKNIDASWDQKTNTGTYKCLDCDWKGNAQDLNKESLKEMANVNKIKLTGAWNIPKIVSKVQDLAVSYGTHFADGVIDTKGLLDRELNGLMGDLKGMGLNYQTESLKESIRTCDFCGKQYDSAVKQSNYPYCSKACEYKDNVGVGTHDESLKESTDREIEAKKMFGKAYKDLTPAEKDKVDEANMVSLALGIESLKEYSQYSEIPADLKNLDSKYYSDNNTEDELLKMIRADLPALSKYSDSEIKSAISVLRSK